MKKNQSLKGYPLLYVLVLSFAIIIVVLIDHIAPASNVSSTYNKSRQIILDAGHGGEDGGAVSCTGIAESYINLQIATRLKLLMLLFGYDCIMVRDQDVSLHTEGETIAKRKISDLKNRVTIINNHPNALLISIHQNSFPDSRFSGAHVFYNDSVEGKELADHLQSSMINALNQRSRRVPQKTKGIYLMEHIECTGILVECGFLSNPEEEAKLKDGEYQKQLVSVLACVISDHLDRYKID